jgi:capsular exopolysaccharide synthesis family protein
MATVPALSHPHDEPRNHGPQLLALPKRPAEPEGESFAASDALNALRYHLVLFLFLGTLVAVAAGAAAWNLFPPKYTTFALLRVFSNEQAVADRARDGASRTEFGTYLSTQAAVIKSHLVLNRALGRPVGPGGQTLAQLPMLQGLDDPITFLEEKIVIEYSDRSEIMKVGMIGDDPNQIAAAVNAVAQAFIKEVETYKQQNQRRYDKLLAAKIEQEKALEELQKTYEATYRKSGPNEVTAKTRQARMAKYIQLVQDEGRVQNELRWTREQLARAQATVEREKNQPAAAAPEIVVPELGAAIEADPAVAKKAADISRIENYVTYYDRTAAVKNSAHITEYRDLLKREMSALEELKKQTRLRLIQAYVQQQKQAVQKAGGTADPVLEQLRLQTLLDRHDFDLKNIREELVKFADLQQEEAAGGPPPEQTLMEIRLRGLRERVAELASKTDNARTELAADDRVKLYEEAHIPQHKEIKKQLAFTGAGGLAGFFLVGALLTLGEVRKKRMYGANDRLFGRMPLLGRIPEHGFIAPAAGAEPAADDPAGLVFRESIDRVKTLAIRQMTLRKQHTLLVVSPSVDEGKSILAWNLAAGFARTDFKVLFIDANLVRPTIHKHLNTDQAGLSEILRGEANLGDATFSTPIPNLDCMTAGRPDPEARRCLDKPAFSRLLDRARAHYDFVVIDTCALSEAVDPLCLAQRVDAAIVSVRTFKTRSPAAEQAWERLQLLGTPVLGAVLTDPTLNAGEM